MLGFSLALALPFTLLSLFPGWLSSLPKSGGWLNSVKVVLGFLELALALKFLSNVDLASEFTDLIIAQRGFQANSRVITTSDEVLQSLVQLGR